MGIFAPSSLPAGRPESRRLALLKVAPEMWLGLLQGIGGHRITQVGLPSDAKVVDTHYDYFERCIVLTLESESFEVMSPGSHLPSLQVMLTDHGPWEIPESA